MINFDEHINRSQTEATKWERYRNEFKDKKCFPLWIADMDLPCSEEIQNALCKRAQHPIYGYTDRDISYQTLFANRFTSRFEYQLEEKDIVLSTGVMYSITCALRLFSKQKEGVVVLTPCYHPFITAIQHSNRVVVKSEMKLCNHRFEINFEDLDEKLNHASMLLLCNPHNPTGRVFEKEELKHIATLCEIHGIRILSDEIHCDITYTNHAFFPIMMINEYTMQNTIALVSPTKSFNIAGIKISAAIIKNEAMNQVFRKEASTIGISSINLFAMEAVKAAYLESDLWQIEVISYLAKNRKGLSEFMCAYLPNVSYTQPEGTYFYWLNFTAYKNCEHIFYILKDKGGLILSKGEEFDSAYKGWLRLNFACPNDMLIEALEIMHDILEREDRK